MTLKLDKPTINILLIWVLGTLNMGLVRHFSCSFFFCLGRKENCYVIHIPTATQSAARVTTHKMALRNVLMFSRKFSSVASSNISLKGIFIPLTTPFNENQEICFDSLGSNLKKYEELSISGQFFRRFVILISC